MDRNNNLDVLRVAACLAVVLLHTSARTIYLYGEVGALSWNSAALINSATRWCVPVFVMISGALLLQRPIEHPGTFLARRFDKILIPLLVWSPAYLWWRARYYDEAFTPTGIAKEILSGMPYYHLYFLFLIAGLYIFTPAIAAALSKLSKRSAVAYASTILLIAFFTMTYQGIGSNAFTLFVPYVGYFALGALLSSTRVKVGLVAAIFALAVATAAISTSLIVGKSGVNGPWSLYFLAYFSPTVIAMAICVFLLFNSLSFPPRIVRYCQLVSPLTLGIYLIHPMVIEQLRWFYMASAKSLLWPILDVPVTFTLAVVIAGSIAAIIRAIPVVRRAV